MACFAEEEVTGLLDFSRRCLAALTAHDVESLRKVIGKRGGTLKMGSLCTG